MDEVYHRNNKWEYYYQDESPENNLIRPTHCAMVLLILLKSIEGEGVVSRGLFQGRCRQISDLDCKYVFIREIQLSLLESYYKKVLFLPLFPAYG